MDRLHVYCSAVSRIQDTLCCRESETAVQGAVCMGAYLWSKASGNDHLGKMY